MEGKIIQIIPAPADLKAVYEEENGEIHTRVLCIALKDDGDIVLIDIDDSGWIDEPNTASNYKGTNWNSETKFKPKKVWNDERW